jgi:hypothetical protein
VIPAIATLAVVLFPSEHVPPLFASVIVTVEPEVLPVAEQFVNPLGSVTVGEAGTVKLALKTTVIVWPAETAPVELVVKPTVQVVVAPKTCEAPLNVTLLTLVAAEIVTAEPGFVAVVSTLVATLKVLAA